MFLINRFLRALPVLIGVLVVATCLAALDKMAYAAESPVAFAAGSVVTGDAVTAVGNVNIALPAVAPHVEPVVTIGGSLLQPAGAANNASANAGLGLGLYRMVTLGAAYDFTARRGGFMVLGDVVGLINMLQGATPAEAAAKAEGPRMTPALWRFHEAINRPPAGL